MSTVSGCSSARLVLRASSVLAAFLLPATLSLIFAMFLIFTTPARAVVVHGVVTDALGRPVPGARIQLIQGPRPVAIGIAGADGSFEVRSTLAGRFVLLTSAPAFYPGIGQDFFGGFTDQVAQNVVLETSSLQQQVTVTATGMPTPLAQTSSAVTLIPESDLATSIGVVDALRQSPGVDMVETGQAGGVTSLFVRGGNSTANQVLIDGITAGDVGGTFDFGTLSTTGLAGIELYRGTNSALYGTDAGASVLNFNSPRGAATGRRSTTPATQETSIATATRSRSAAHARSWTTSRRSRASRQGTRCPAMNTTQQPRWPTSATRSRPTH